MPEGLGYDRPSPKFLAFLAKFFGALLCGCSADMPRPLSDCLSSVCRPPRVLPAEQQVRGESPACASGCSSGILPHADRAGACRSSTATGLRHAATNSCAAASLCSGPSPQTPLFAGASAPGQAGQCSTPPVPRQATERRGAAGPELHFTLARTARPSETQKPTTTQPQAGPPAARRCSCSGCRQAGLAAAHNPGAVANPGRQWPAGCFRGGCRRQQGGGQVPQREWGGAAASRGAVGGAMGPRAAALGAACASPAAAPHRDALTECSGGWLSAQMFVWLCGERREQRRPENGVGGVPCDSSSAPAGPKQGAQFPLCAQPVHTGGAGEAWQER